MKGLTMLAAIAVLSACASVCAGAATGVAASEEVLREKAYEGRLSVRDFGARGDGVTDDTAAIQAGIDFLAKRGGGKLFFPFTTNGYLIASPGREFDAEGRLVRAQLVIPAGLHHNIRLEGEMPCRLLYNYQVRTGENPKLGMTRFGENSVVNVMLHSTWDAPEVTNVRERVWSVIAAPEGKVAAGNFSASIFSFANLEIRVHLNTEKMYPTTSAANFHNIARLIVENSQFCLDDAVGDAVLKKELQESPCPAAGLIMSNGLNDQQIIHGVNVQGFKYGIVMAEHTHATYLYLHNNEYALTFSESAYVSAIDFVTAQHNRCILHVPNNGLYGRGCGPDVRSAVQVDLTGLSVEDGKGTWPKVSQLKWGVYDPNDRLRGVVEYRVLDFGYPWRPTFPVVGARRLKVVDFETGDVTARY